jgi:hypothetical protein
MFAGLHLASHSARTVNRGEPLDKLFTSDDERNEKRLEIVKAERDFSLAALQVLEKSDEKQADINIEEVRTGSFFMAGWRPAIGWIGVLGSRLSVRTLSVPGVAERAPAPAAGTGGGRAVQHGDGDARHWRHALLRQIAGDDTQVIGKAPGK